MLKIITARHRLVFSKQLTIFVTLDCGKTSGRVDLEGPLIFKLFHS